MRPTVSHRKPKADLYTILLVMSLIAVLIAILFLYLNMKRYDFKRGPGAAAAPVRAAANLAWTPAPRQLDAFNRLA